MMIPSNAEVIDVSNDTAGWIRKVVEGLDKNVDRETCARILEACGRQCAPQGLIDKARETFEDSADIGEFLAKLGDFFDVLRLEDEKVFVVYPECYCEQVKDIPPEDLPNNYCDCSVGWVKQVFEGALGRPVDVKRISSVIAGDAECRFEIDLTESA